MKERVLIADTNPTFVWRAHKILAARAGAQYQIRSTTNGAEAFAMLQMDPPSVAVLGSDLPEMGGVAIVAALAGKSHLSGCRFLGLLDGKDAQQKQALANAGAQGYLVKPVNPETLAACILELATLGRLAPAAGDAKLEHYDILLAEPTQLICIRRQLERHTGIPLVIAESAEIVAGLAPASRGPRLRAVFATDPVPAMNLAAFFEYMRSQGVTAPIVRIGEGNSPHPGLFTLRPEFSATDLAGIVEKIGRLAPDRQINANDRVLRARTWEPAARPASPPAERTLLSSAA